MHESAQKIAALLDLIPPSLREIDAEIAFLRERINELEAMPRATGSIWARESTAEGRKGDPEHTAYYITHHRSSPYWADEDYPKDRRERIGAGQQAKTEAEQRFANQDEYFEKMQRLNHLERILSRAVRDLRSTARDLGVNPLAV